MKSFVINLKKRPDRLAKFQQQFDPSIFSTFTVLPAFDGSTLNISELQSRINPWNITHLSPYTLRGVVGCALSHLECYRLIQQDTSSDYFFIFEDDASFIDSDAVSRFSELFSNIDSLSFPSDLGILYLNSFYFSFTNQSISNKVDPNTNWYPTTHCYTTESYLIHKECAKYLYELNINNLGAIDAHISQQLNKDKDTHWKTYALTKPLFFQQNRKDSNIR